MPPCRRGRVLAGGFKKTLNNLTMIEIKSFLEMHAIWLRGESGGERANLRRADLRRADLSGANLSDANLSDADLRRADLSDADLRRADLRRADLSDANLSDADLSGANLSGADLRRADLSDANLSGANLSGADLRGADLSDANLSDANLSGANLSDANLSDANLSGANLSGANLSGANGLIRAVDFFEKNFQKSVEGYRVFKRIGPGKTPNIPPDRLEVIEGSIIEEVPNPDRCTECGCGVNFGTLDYCNKNSKDAELWECLLRFEDLADTVVPYMTDGKARCARLTLIKKIS